MRESESKSGEGRGRERENFSCSSCINPGVYCDWINLRCLNQALWQENEDGSQVMCPHRTITGPGICLLCGGWEIEINRNYKGKLLQIMMAVYHELESTIKFTLGS